MLPTALRLAPRVSQELDAKERALMLSEGMTADASRFLAEASGNVDESGNFSIQVGGSTS